MWKGGHSVGGSATPGHVVPGELRKSAKQARGASYSCTQHHWTTSFRVLRWCMLPQLKKQEGTEVRITIALGGFFLLWQRLRQQAAGGKRFILTVLHWGKSEQEPGSGTEERHRTLLISLLLVTCLINFLSSPRTMCPGVALPPSELGSYTSITDQQMP